MRKDRWKKLWRKSAKTRNNPCPFLCFCSGNCVCKMMIIDIVHSGSRSSNLWLNETGVLFDKVLMLRFPDKIIKCVIKGTKAYFAHLRKVGLQVGLTYSAVQIKSKILFNLVWSSCIMGGDHKVNSDWTKFIPKFNLT